VKEGRDPLTIAIDGPAASGKGTLARRIAAHFNLACLDTGLLYRAVARDVRASGGSLEDAQLAATVARELDPATLDDPGLRDAGLGDAASIVARLPEVRRALLSFQREFAARSPGAVLDGRDIGTVVCPDADVKFFITASAEVRARRRYLEQEGRGEPVTYEAVLADIRRRDQRDADRQAAPMRPAEDAILLDTSNLDIEAAFDTAVGVILRKIGQRGRA
jgi:cytidylate kinase